MVYKVKSNRWSQVHLAPAFVISDLHRCIDISQLKTAADSVC